jgi:hypothetical protein
MFVGMRVAAGIAVVLAVSALWFMGSSSTHADANGSVTVLPQPEATVGAGGTTTVSVSVSAPDAGLSVWIVEIGYDPAIVQVDTINSNPACETFNVPDPGGPGNVVQAKGCAVKAVASAQNNRAVAFGAWVKNVNSTATGWTGTQTVANFTFKAVGAAGQESPLTVTVADGSFLLANGNTTSPATPDGKIRIIAGTTRIWGNTDCDDDGVTSRDAQAVLKIVGLKPPLSKEPGCPSVGDNVTVDGTSRKWGNWDCDADVSSRDAQAVLKKVGLKPPLSQTEPPDCPDIGVSVTVS